MTVVGDASVFAIESGISRAYSRRSERALGYFVLHINGQQYGVRAPEATLLACSFDNVAMRLQAQGRHSVAGVGDSPAHSVATAFLRGRYPLTDAVEESDEHFADLVVSAGCEWAPDGDEAFDDGSHVLQFDVGDRVRLVAFRRSGVPLEEIASLSELWLPAEKYYGVLSAWLHAFEIEWAEARSTGGPH